VRCVQTLEPLAHLLREPVHVDERLAEGSSFASVMELFAALPDGAVLCSHGDVIPEVIDALVRRGCEITGEPEWRKASTWVLRRDDGMFTAARAWPPPDG
jgi:8-oxo-dGTP diphosphatase